MKKIFLVILLLSKIAVAQTESVVPTASPTPVEKKEEPIKIAEIPTEKKPISFFVGALYNTAKGLSFKSMTITDTTIGSASGSADISTDSSAGLTAGIQKLKKNGWGYIASGTYNLDKKLNTFNLSSGGVNATGSFSGSPKLSIITLDGMAAFTFNNDAYFAIGANYSSVTLKEYAGGSMSIKGNIGYGFGGGFSIEDNIQIEVISKTIKMDIVQKDSTTTIDYKTGELQGIQIAAKYLF